MAAHEFRFSFGNSSVGPIGGCVSIYAETPEDGLDQLKELLTRYAFENGVRLETPEGLEDLVVYINPAALRMEDIECYDLSEADDGKAETGVLH